MPQQTRGTFAVVSEGSLGRLGLHIPPLTPTKSALTLGRASAMYGSDAQKGSQGREPRVRDRRLQGGNSDRSVFIQTQGSSDQILAVKTDENEISSYCTFPVSV